MAWTERYVRTDAAGGADGTNDTTSGTTGAWTLAEAISSVAAGHRVNIRAGTYANTTNNRTFATAGTTTAPIWWRGFNTTPGDCDSDFSLTLPSITFTSGNFRVTHAHQIFSNLTVTASAVASGAIYDGAGGTTGIWYDRMHIENTNAHASACAFLTDSSHKATFSRCLFKATSTATYVVDCSGATGGPHFDFFGNTFQGGGSGCYCNAGGGDGFRFIRNIFDNVGGYGIYDTGTAGTWLIDNAFYSPGNDGARFTATKTVHCHAIGNLFEACLYGLNNTSGTNTNLLKRLGNGFYNMTSGNEAGFGDSPSLSEISLSASPFVNASGGDFTTATGNARGGGQPTKFMGLALTNYLDAGPVQHQGVSGGGGGSGYSRARVVNHG